MSDSVEREALRRIRADGRAREVALELLGTSPGRLLLICEPSGEGASYESLGYRRVTGVMTRTGVEQWRAAWGREVVTVEELADWSAIFRARGCRIKAWDSLNSKPVGAGDELMWNWEFDAVEEGWREPADGPPEAMARDRSSVSTDAARAFFDSGNIGHGTIHPIETDAPPPVARRRGGRGELGDGERDD